LTDAATQSDTEELRQEGLGRPRLGHALSLTEDDTGNIARTAPSGFPLVDGDYHVRLIWKYLGGGSGSQVLFELQDENDATRRIKIIQEPGGGLTVEFTSAYTPLLGFTVNNDEWNLIDIGVDRDGAGGNAAGFIFINGVDFTPGAHTSTIDDVREGAGVALLNGIPAAAGSSADKVEMAFAGIALERTIDLNRHLIDALALGVR
jgi:hypothetical protein